MSKCKECALFAESFYGNHLMNMVRRYQKYVEDCIDHQQQPGEDDVFDILMNDYCCMYPGCDYKPTCCMYEVAPTIRDYVHALRELYKEVNVGTIEAYRVAANALKKIQPLIDERFKGVRRADPTDPPMMLTDTVDKLYE